MNPRLVEFISFVVAALGLHVALWPSSSEVPGQEGAGAGGTAALSLVASTATLDALVTQWETPPELAPSPVAPMVPPESSAPTPPTSSSAPMRPVLSSSIPLLSGGGRDPAPVADIQTAPQVVSKLAPLASIRPPTRPEHLRPPPAPRATPQVAPRRTQPSGATTSQPSRTSRGSGGGQTAGRSGGAETALNQGNAQQALARWGGQIRTAIERRKRFPRGVRASGRATVALTVSTEGRLISARLARSSGHKPLDEAALSAVRNARLPSAIRGVPRGQHSFQVSLSFSR